MVELNPPARESNASPTPAQRSALSQHTQHYNYEVGGLLAFGALILTASHLNVARPWHALAIELGAIALVAISFFCIGLPAWRQGNRPRLLLSMAINIVAVGISTTQGTVNGFLPIVVMLDIWTSLERKRERIVATLALALVTVLGLAHIAGWNWAEFRVIGTQPLFFFGVALGGAIWMSRSYEISRTNAQLVDELRQAQAQIGALQFAAGETAERERMASEIHDTLAQGFNSIVMQIQATTIALERGNLAAIPQRLAIMEAVAQENLAEARGLVAANAPISLQDSSLDQALHRLGDRWARETGIRVTVTTDDHHVTTTAQEVVLLRAAQEALTNVRKHAEASEATVALASTPDGGVSLTVTDNGRGTPDDVTEGFGLEGMRERVQTVGGTLVIKPRAIVLPDDENAPAPHWDTGTSVQINLPAY